MFKIIIFFCFAIYSAFSYSISVTDMVPLNTPKGRIYMDIFETSWNGDDENSKPARTDFSTASQYCANKGKRLATYQEWMLAATNHGENKQYTLLKDILVDSNMPNIFSRLSSGSQYIYDVNNLGIDAVGTVALTGNRYEWVRGQNGEEIACGGEYETNNHKYLRLDNTICLNNIREASSRGNATARCVVDGTGPSDSVTFSYKVPDNLKQLIQRNLEKLNNEFSAGGQNDEDVDLDDYIDEFDIDDDEDDFF